jgi:hypothetical protein
MALLIFPFTFNALLHLGFYNFSIGVVLYLFTLGYWLRHRNDDNRRWPFVLSLLMLVMFLAHLFPLLALWLSIAILSLNGWGKAHVRMLLKTFAACVPAAILMLTSWHDVANPIEPRDIPPPMSVIEILRELPGLLMSYSPLERWPAMLVFLALVIAADVILIQKILRRSWSWRDLLLVLAGVFMVQALLNNAPRSWELMIRPRAELFATISLILWFAAQDLSPRVRNVLVGTFLSASCAMLVIQTRNYRNLSEWLSEYASAGAYIERDATVLPLYMPRSWNDAGGKEVTIQVTPFAHASAYLALERGAIDLVNYEPNTRHFPLIFRSGMNPFERLGHQIYRQPPCVALDAFPIDYVLIWGDVDAGHDECAVKLQEQLAHWHLVYTSPHKMVRLYRKS